MIIGTASSSSFSSPQYNFSSEIDCLWKENKLLRNCWCNWAVRFGGWTVISSVFVAAAELGTSLQILLVQLIGVVASSLLTLRLVLLSSLHDDFSQLSVQRCTVFVNFILSSNDVTFLLLFQGPLQFGFLVQNVLATKKEANMRLREMITRREEYQLTSSGWTAALCASFGGQMTPRLDFVTSWGR